MGRAAAAWSDLDAESLLDQPLARLGLRLEESPLAPRVARLLTELERRQLVFRPHLWLSTAFFSADGVPGVALPFALAHPRLVRLERAQLGHLEGVTRRDCLRLLRHETGHAIDTAYRLSRRPAWRAAFGRRSAPYLQSFRVDPGRTDCVRYLPRWYAQSHPAEDFAESFAVWLDPSSRWRQRYPARGRWRAARAKLELVQQLMDALGDRSAPVRLTERVEPLQQSTLTLREFYRRRRIRRAREPRAPFEAWLLRHFEATRQPGARVLPAARSEAGAWLARQAPALRRGLDPYAVDQVLQAMQHFARWHGLRLNRDAGAPRLIQVKHTIQAALEALRQGRWRLAR